MTDINRENEWFMKKGKVMLMFNRMFMLTLIVLLFVNPMAPIIEAIGVESNLSGKGIFNEEILNLLSEEYGEEQAIPLFKAIVDTGLVDENGFFQEHPIYYKDNAYSLEKMRQILVEEQGDLSQMVEIDGEQISLETLQQIMQIEDEIEELSQAFNYDDVTITPDHLDSLDSLITQSEDEGLILSGGEESFSLSDDGEAGNTDEYDDGVFVTMTGSYREEINIPPPSTFKHSITFELNEAQDETVSFSYEVIDGTLQSNGLTTLSPSPEEGIVFEPGETKVVLSISVKKDDIYSLQPVPAEEELEEFFLSISEFRNDVWSGYSRTDYLHFYDFKNFDYMEIDTKEKLKEVIYDDYTPYSHVYEGGAYFSLAMQGGLSYGHQSMLPAIFRFDQHFDEISLRDDQPELLEVRARPGTYKTGQILPIQATFSHPIMHRNWTDSNNSVLNLEDGLIASPEIQYHVPDILEEPKGGEYTRYIDFPGLSFVRGYQAIIEPGTTVEQLKVESATGIPSLDYAFAVCDYIHKKYDNYCKEYAHESSGEAPGEEILEKLYDSVKWDKEFTNEPKIEIELAKADAFQSIKLDKDNYKIGETAEVTVELYDDDEATEWLLQGLNEPEDLFQHFIVSIGNREQGHIDNLDFVRDAMGEPIKPYILEGTFDVTEKLFDYMSETNRPDGKLRAKIYYNLGITNDEDDHFKLLAEEDMLHYFTVEEPKYILPDDLEIVYPKVWPSDEDFKVYLTSATSTQLDFTFPEDATFQANDQFEWESNDETVAGITEEGVIVPYREGEVTFKLIAKNGGALEEQTEVNTETIQIRSGGVPQVVVPDFANRVYVQQGNDANILWTTNVMDKYEELAGVDGEPDGAHFTIELFDDFLDESDMDGQKPVKTWDSSEDPELINATSFTIPGENLTEISVDYDPSYTVRISTPHPIVSSTTLSTHAYIVVDAKPATVQLENKKEDPYYIDNVGKIDLLWKLENFHPSPDANFEFMVTRNGELIEESEINFDPSEMAFVHQLDSEVAEDVDEDGGKYQLIIDPVNAESNRFKDVYAITIAVQNDAASTRSYDSLYLQVYKNNSLQIQIDGQSKTEHAMSNIDKISGMTNEERVALNRNISLRNNMSINNRDFSNMGEITDQIKWKSSDNDIGVINYSSHGTIANVEDYYYDSYQPNQNFILSGLEDGKTKITAIHARTGMKTELDLEVETLKDKLYLFQFYPKVETTVTYMNSQGEEEIVTSDENGELALFDEQGIGSDVYVTSKFNNSTYTGVLSYQTLLTKEKDPAITELYPINILQLRELAKVEVFFKTPDGQPYTGEVTYRGGVYRNGYYSERTDISGEGITVDLDSDGGIEVIFNTTDFYSEEAGEENASTLSAKDNIEVVFEFMFEDDRYYPQLLPIDGNANPVDMVEFGEKIVVLADNPTVEKTPFMVNQFVSDDSEHNKNSILTYNGKFGPNNQFPEVTLMSEFLWWGEEIDEESVYVELFNDVDKTPSGQSYKTVQYPFSDLYVTQHYQILNSETIWLEKGESGSVHYRLYDDDQSFRKSFTSASSLINMIGVEEISGSDLKKSLEDMRENMTESSYAIENPTVHNDLAADFFLFMGKLNFDVGPLQMKVIPTDDPLVYETIIATSFSNLPSTSAGNTDGGSSEVEFMHNDRGTYVPGLMDTHKMMKGTYNDNLKEKYTNDLKGKSNGRGMFSVGGYYLGEIKYNPETKLWENIVLSGGFNAGGGYEMTRNMNQTIGPVPVTFSVSVGGAAEIDFKSSVLFDQVGENEWRNQDLTSVNDYLTSLRVIAYLELFGGIGFDYTVIAAKIGMFGRITLENTSTWLDREYLTSLNDRYQFGNMLTLEGVAGVRAVLKFLFFSKSYTFASAKYSHSWVFHHWDAIQEYWNKYGNEVLTDANIDLAISSYMNYIGEEEIHVLETNTLEDRSYLERGGRAWYGGEPQFGLMSLDPENKVPEELQRNAYPYADPQLADDGSLFVYLSDSGSEDIEDTVASWATINSAGHYEDKGKIVNSTDFQGYGDSNLQVAGEGNTIAAVWVTQKDKIKKDPGEDISDEDVLLMNNSTEIMASIYNGTNWSTHRLTKNMHPDLAPVVSVGNGKVFVAYRSVYASNIDNPLDFSDADSIVYTVYDLEKKKWSDEETVYNGTNGTVMGLSAATLVNDESDTATIVYNVNNGDYEQRDPDNYVAGEDNEVIYSVINLEEDADVEAATWRTKGVIKNLQVTNDNNANENPQITSAIFADGVERFVIAWHTTGDETGAIDQDIKLLAVNENGEVYHEFIDSLNVLQANNAIKISPNFTFVKMKKGLKRINNLSLLWKEAEFEENEAEVISRDLIKAVKFSEDKESIYLSGAIDVATMPDYTEVDLVDAYVSNALRDEIKAVILGTTYTTDVNEIGEIELQNPDEKIESVPIVVSEMTSGMYTATESYENKFSVEEVAVSPNEIVIGYDLPVQFNLVNQGISMIDSITVNIDGQETEFEDVSLLPNNSKVITVPYEVPTPIHDVEYEVNVTYADKTEFSKEGDLVLDIPDLGLSKGRLVAEESGKRTLSVPIYNKNDTVLHGKGRTVHLGLYSNTNYTDEYLIGDIVEISDDNDLKLIDEGAYTEMVTFDIQDYLSTLDLTEIPDDGLMVFLHGWVEDEDGKKIIEFDQSDNQTNVMIENLAIKYNNDRVLLTLEQSNLEGKTTVELTMQNMNMEPIENGNTLVQLLDRDENVLESHYLVTEASDLLSFDAEERIQKTIEFSQTGQSVQATFFQEKADTYDATLNEVKISGVAIDFDSEQTTYELEASDLNKTNIVAVASNKQATVSILNEAGEVIRSQQGHLSLDKSLLHSIDGVDNVFTISVEPESASGKKENYQFTINNKSTEKPALELSVEGELAENGDYLSDVDLTLPAYQLTNYDIEKAFYRINNSEWIEFIYDGTTDQRLTTVKAINGRDSTSYHVEAKIKLADGKARNLESVKFNIANMPNAPTIETKTEWTNDTEVPVTITTNEDDVEIEYQLNGTAGDKWESYSESFEITDEGETRIYARTVNKVGMTSEITKAIVRIDRTVPNPPSIDIKTSDWTNDTEVPVAITTDTKDVDIEYQLNGTVEDGWLTYSSDLTIKDEGKTTIYARVIDHIGNVSDIVKTVARIDNTAPSLELEGDNPMYVEHGGVFIDPGSRATDNFTEDEDLRVNVTGEVDTNQVGVHELTYTVQDKAKNKTVLTRAVHVIDKEFPIIRLSGDNPMQVEVGTAYEEPGVKAEDNADGNLSKDVKISGSVDTGQVGTYSVTYTVSDSSGNKTEVTRTVEVVDTTAPEITLHGKKNITLELGDVYKEAGFDASDNYDGDISKAVEISGSVDTHREGIYLVTYTVSDSSGNKASAARTVHIKDTTAPTEVNLKAKETSVGYVALSFSAEDQAGINEYIIFKDGKEIARVDGNKTTYLDEGVEEGTTYTYGIIALDPSNNKSKMVEEKVTTKKEVQQVVPHDRVLKLDDSPQPVEAREMITIQDTRTGIQLPADLPAGTTLQVLTVEEIKEQRKLTQAGEVYDFVFTYPDGYESYEGDFILTMEVVDKSKEAAIYHYNDAEEVWERISGSQVNDGLITATVTHFSQYGVFVEKKEEPTKRFSLPGTSTNQYNWLLAGVLLIILGSSVWIVFRKKKFKK